MKKKKKKKKKKDIFDIAKCREDWGRGGTNEILQNLEMERFEVTVFVPEIHPIRRGCPSLWDTCRPHSHLYSLNYPSPPTLLQFNHFLPSSITFLPTLPPTILFSMFLHSNYIKFNSITIYFIYTIHYLILTYLTFYVQYLVTFHVGTYKSIF